MMTLGQVLKMARKKYGMTIRAVESKCGISNAYLSQLENDKVQSPTIHILRSLSVAYPMYEKEILMTQGLTGVFEREVKGDD